MVDPKGLRPRRQRLDQAAEAPFVAEQQEAEIGEPLARQAGTLDHHRRRLVAAHGIECDRNAPLQPFAPSTVPPIPPGKPQAPEGSTTSRPL